MKVRHSRRSASRPATPDVALPDPALPDPALYARLADFRYLLRRFLAFSEVAAKEAGLTPRQHQALLAIKGMAEGRPSVGDLAERLGIRHHSAVELIDRLAEAGLVLREHDPEDRRKMLLILTGQAEARLAALSVAHLDELRRLRPALAEILDGLPGDELS